jgi:hypothetical protein
MVSLTQSSVELRVALDKLAMLVHCSWHDHGLAKQLRIEDWTAAFPVGDAATDPAASVEKRIRKVLILESAQCSGIAASTGRRCRWDIGGQRVRQYEATVDEIVKPDVYLDDISLDSFLRLLETNMYCHFHNKKPPKMVGSWKSSIVEIRKGQLLKSVGSRAPGVVGVSSGARNTRGSESPSTKESTGSISRSGGLPIQDFGRKLSTYRSTSYDTSPFDIIPKNAEERLADYKSSCAKVKSEMMRELDPKDPTSGYVYAYEVEGNAGFVKIGYTGRLVEDRHQEWSFACNRAAKVLYPIPSGIVAAVRNPHRVEELCHAELNHRRIRIYCKACLKQHLEWFEIPAADAIAVIQNWTKWMSTGPYQRIELRSGVKWTIKEEERRRTRDMERFIKEISAGPKPTAILEASKAVTLVSQIPAVGD